MGEFVAYKVDNEGKVKKIGHFKTNVAYFERILPEALGEYFIRKTTNTNTTLFGTIKIVPEIPDGKAALKRIAEEEDKYHYKWQDGEVGVFRGKQKELSVEFEPTDKPVPVLDRLRRVDVYFYQNQAKYPICATGTGRGIFDAEVNNALKNQDSSIKEMPEQPPLWLEVKNNSKVEVEVHVSDTAKALYLDTNEETQAHKFKKDPGGKAMYIPVRTWKPEELDGEVNDSNYNNYPTPKDRTGKNKDRNEDDTKEKNKAQKDREDIRMKVSRRRAWIDLGLKNPPQWKTFLSGRLLSKNTEWSKLEDVPKKRVTAKAEFMARVIPDTYECFYYREGNEEKGELDGFVAKVVLSSGSTGAGGYSGRADAADEVDYRWKIVPTVGTIDFDLANVLSALIGLDQKKLDKPVVGFYETNYPNRTLVIDKPGEEGIPLLFRYYKKFEADAVRKNEPKEKPGEPRLPKKTDRTTDKSLRKWMKGPTLKGMAGEQQDKSTRDSAGGAMGQALSNFKFFPQAMNQYPEITSSQLSATSFARYVVVNDATINAAWKTANNLKAEVEVQATDVRTDQEWCHLFGHGDGGTETFNNFISGSKHCNTEQLAIETGQRRVSQREDIDPQIRKRLRWRITADQWPNEGTAVRELSAKSADEVLSKLKECPVDTGLVKKDFFVDEDKSNKLLDDVEIRTGLKKLASIIGKEKRARNGEKDKNKKKDATTRVTNLVAFQSIFLKECFTHYPLGRLVRYRIWFAGTKCFEHLFDAQSESFNVMEAKILDYTVERAIYLTMDKIKPALKIGELTPLDYYIEMIKSRAAKLKLNDDEINIAEEFSTPLNELAKELGKKEGNEKTIETLVQDITTLYFKYDSKINKGFNKSVKTNLKKVPQFKNVKEKAKILKLAVTMNNDLKRARWEDERVEDLDRKYKKRKGSA